MTLTIVALFAAVLLFGPLMIYSVMRRHAIKEKEKAWHYVIRAVLPPLSFVFYSLVLILVDTVSSRTQQPIYESELPDWLTMLVWLAVFLLLCFDNIRCKSVINRVLGALYLLLGLVVLFVAIMTT